jgi:acetyl-CoA acyltransferase
MSQAFVYDAVRTPFGKFGSGLAAVRPDDLAAHVIRESVKRAPGLDPERIDEVVFGNANGAGEENRNIARMGTLLAGLPVSIPGTSADDQAHAQRGDDSHGPCWSVPSRS